MVPVVCSIQNVSFECRNKLETSALATFGIKWDNKGLTCDGNVYKCTICEVHMSYARRDSTIRMALSKVTQLKKMNDSSLGSS